MKNDTILHLFNWDKKFFLPFRELIQKNFNDGRHKFIVYGNVKQDEDLHQLADTLVYASVLKNSLTISKAIYHAEKIILHGLFNNHLLYILALQPWLLKKCCWVIWGGDLYIHKSKNKDWRWWKNEVFRKIVLKSISLITTTVPGDYFLAQEWYGTKAKYIQNLMYFSHVYREIKNDAITHHNKEKIAIQIGNSADPTNNHREIIDKLAQLSARDFTAYVPLSYGDEVYRNEIIAYGLNKLGDKFIPLTDFMTFSQYNDYMQNIDIAIFNHNRQQAMGNTIALLSLGKKVYIRDDVTPWNYFLEMGLSVYNTKGTIELQLMEAAQKKKNILICRKEFSVDALIQAWSKIFSEPIQR